MRNPDAADASAAARTPFSAQLEIVLDRLSEGTIVIDGGARILHANRRARELLRRVAPPHAPGGRLCFAHAATEHAFRRALRPTPLEDDDERAHDFLVRTAAGETVARASVETLQRSSTSVPDRFLVSLHQLPQHARVSIATLRALYGLTPSEARVAARVVAAGSVAELASCLALSRNTVKTHLRRTFRKCEVSSLAQLTALIATGPREV